MSDHNQTAPKSFSHEKVETNNFLLIVLTLLVVAVGGMVIMAWNTFMTIRESRPVDARIPEVAHA